MADHGRPDHEAVLQFVERFAMALTDMSMQRMPARVFAYVLIDDADRYTAAELSEALRVSPAAISGAVRTLVQAGLLGKEREPGARADSYRIYDDELWASIMLQRIDWLEPFIKLAEEGAEMLGPQSPGGRRMRETQLFYRFISEKMAEVIDEWRQVKQELFAEFDAT